MGYRRFVASHDPIVVQFSSGYENAISSWAADVIWLNAVLFWATGLPWLRNAVSLWATGYFWLAFADMRWNTTMEWLPERTFSLGCR